MKQELISRYVYAATKRMPKESREDIGYEIESMIDDMLLERCGDNTPTEKDIQVILTELGTPSELHEQYSEDQKKCLIGSPYYGTYMLVLKIVLVCVSLGMTLSFLITSIIEPTTIWYENVLNFLGMIWSGLLAGFSFVTIIFAIFYHKGIKINAGFNLNDLPPVPSKKKEISKKETIIEIGMSIILFAVFLAAPQIFGVLLSDPIRIVPIFDVAVIRETWYLVMLFAAMGITRESFKLIEGQYTKKVMMTVIITNIASAVFATIWLVNEQIMNQEFVRNIQKIFESDAEFIIRIFSNFQFFFLGIIILALVLDTADTIYRTFSK